MRGLLDVVNQAEEIPYIEELPAEVCKLITNSTNACVFLMLFLFFESSLQQI